MTEKYFRGFHAIGEVAKKARRIADNAAFLPNVRTLRLYRRDYDLVARWPNAAKLHGFEFTAGVMSFHGFQLAYDHTAQRYPTNADDAGPAIGSHHAHGAAPGA